MIRPDSPHRPKSNAPAIWLAVGVVVVLLGVVAVLATRGSSDGDEEVPNQVGQVEIPGKTAPPGDQEPDVTAAESEPGPTVTTLPAASEPGSTPLPLFEDPADDLAVGMTIPTVAGTDLQGAPLTIGAGDGKAKVILFVAHWCPHCQAEIPKLAEHFEANGLPDDVEIVGISTRVDADRPNYPPSSWLEDESWTVPTLKDSEDSLAFLTFGAGSFPYFVAVDADGKVVARTSGELPMETFDRFVDVARTGSV